MGASLQTMIADDQCSSVISIDPRCEAPLPDARGLTVYPRNTVERMLELLAGVRGADLTKLHTFDASTKDLSAEAIQSMPRLCFVDGEHTSEAALRDARFCLEVMGGEGAILFHDRSLVFKGIATFLAELRSARVAYVAYPLRSVHLMLELGKPHLLAHDCVRKRVPFPGGLFWPVRSTEVRAPVRLRALLGAEQVAKSILPSWVKGPIRAVIDPRSADVEHGPRGEMVSKPPVT